MPLLPVSQRSARKLSSKRLILNSVVDALAELLDRGALFLHDHWGALMMIAIAASVGTRFRIPVRIVELCRSIATRPVVPYAMVGLLSLTLSIAAAALHGLPLPNAHDDFAYLLTGELFAHGRASML